LFEVKRARFPKDLDGVLSIYREYIGSTSVSLDFQKNEDEFSNLATKYESSGTGIFLACSADQIVGCAAFRKLDDKVCEMKRVYVRPCARGHGLGLVLVERVLKEAELSGYEMICLDVLPEFTVAEALYRSLGFKDIEPLTFNPVPGTAFLGLALN